MDCLLRLLREHVAQLSSDSATSGARNINMGLDAAGKAWKEQASRRDVSRKLGGVVEGMEDDRV